MSPPAKEEGLDHVAVGGEGQTARNPPVTALTPTLSRQREDRRVVHPLQGWVSEGRGEHLPIRSALSFPPLPWASSILSSLIPPPRTGTRRAGSLAGDHARPHRVLRRADPPEQRALGRLDHAPQHLAAAAARVLPRRAGIHRQDAGGVEGGVLLPDGQAAAGDHAMPRHSASAGSNTWYSCSSAAGLPWGRTTRRVLDLPPRPGPPPASAISMSTACRMSSGSKPATTQGMP